MGGEGVEAERRRLARAVRELFRAGLISPGGGNVSCRAGGEFLITPSGRHKGRLVPADMVRLTADGRSTGGRASVEAGLHLAVYRARPDVGAVVHNHAPLTQLLGITDLTVPAVSLESVAFLDLPRVDFLPPGDPGLAAATARALGGSAAVLLVNHGAVTTGPDLDAAVALSLALEAAARTTLWLHLLRSTMATIDPHLVGELLARGRL
jgi:L-fuculose-phosphate aldolase